ncbi:MAG: wax ester/triacylglycerol synthase family O-acyltransferase [Halioglobus sp.]
MEKLSFLDMSFLRLESPQRPFHVAGLMIFKQPDPAPRNHVRRLVAWAQQLNTIWPVCNKKLSDPLDLGKAGWVQEDHYQPERHVLHYSLPQPGRMEDLLNLVARAHERPLDRSRPLWELHVIEGLPGNRVAAYCKVHHALIDGVGGMRMLSSLFTTSPTKRARLPGAEPVIEQEARRQSLARSLEDTWRGLREQYRAIPSCPRCSPRWDWTPCAVGRGCDETAIHLPAEPVQHRNGFRPAHHTLRPAVWPVRSMAREAGGSINDVLLAICGGALRRYLIAQNALPRKSLIAGLPVSIRRDDDSAGNHLSFILCPYFTNEADDLKRLQRVIRATTRAKAELAGMSATAGQDFTNLVLLPLVLLTVTGNATRVAPAVNAIFSNVPGSSRKLYLEGSELESLYPVSIVTDGMGINLTVVSYDKKLCFAITSCPTGQPGIEQLDDLLRQSYRDLRAALLSR